MGRPASLKTPDLGKRWQLCRGISGSFHLESVAGLLWNQWQLSYGTGGSFAVASVAGFTWNRWQLWRGIRTPGDAHTG
jgi:hypothetical protein